ncbi:MAG: dienelactone hydrolase family protein [Clostridia bacterium]|nr:dienelactone hydrolase family protein [Clostridia bacterium]
MGFVLFLLTAAFEIALVVMTCRKATEKKTWRKNRLFVRLTEIVIAIVAILLPFGQKWRLTGVLITLAVLAFIVALAILCKRKKTEGDVRKGKAIASGVMSILLIGFALVPAFVFTGYKGLPTSGAYAVRETSAILVDGTRTDPFETDGSSREVPVHFYYPETENSTERFPLVVFSHGAFGYYQSNTSTYMELASNGYVVAALDHPHHAFFTKDTDGKTVIVDMDFMNTALTLNEQMGSEKLYALYTEWMALRTADMNLAVDAIKTAVTTGATDASWFVPEKNGEAIRTVLSMTDIERIGLMGHSMGGATAVALGRERDDIDAVIDVDGTMLSEYTGVENGALTVREDPYTVPVLAFDNWDSYNDMEEYVAQGGIHPNAVLLKNASAGFQTTVRGSKHMDFTDLPLLSPILGNMLGSGERDTKETMTIVNSLVLEFFNCYLRGEGVFTANETY